MGFNKEEFNKFLIRCGVVMYSDKPFKLKSGKLSNWYFNLRRVTNDVYAIEKLANYIISYVEEQGLDVECFYGVPEGATKIGIITQFIYAKNNPEYGFGTHMLPMGRGKIKNHGAEEDRYFIGKPEGKTFVIEDVATTGTSLIESIKRLKECKVPICGCCAIIDRSIMEYGESIIKDKIETTFNIPYFYMTDAQQLLRTLYEKVRDEQNKKKN